MENLKNLKSEMEDLQCLKDNLSLLLSHGKKKDIKTYKENYEKEVNKKEKLILNNYKDNEIGLATVVFGFDKFKNGREVINTDCSCCNERDLVKVRKGLKLRNINAKSEYYMQCKECSCKVYVDRIVR